MLTMFLVLINATKDAVRFNVQGDSGCGSIAIRSNMAVDKKDGGSQGTMIRMIEPASIHVALKFLTQFSKASALSETVNLEFSNDCPIMAKFPIAEYGFLRFFLAPKVDDDEIMN